MAWFKRKDKKLKDPEKKSIPDGLWDKCPSCNEIIYKPELEKKLSVCQHCNHHFRVLPDTYVRLLLDDATATTHFSNLLPKDFLNFKADKAYKDQIVAAKKKTGENDAIRVYEGKINKRDKSVTSSRLQTYQKFDFKPGTKIIARIKLPWGQGIWPAFWALGSNYSEVGWPSCGEIDILEMTGANPINHEKNYTIHSTCHWNDVNDPKNYKHAQHGKPLKLTKDFVNDYHLYEMIYQSDYIQTKVDGKEIFKINTSAGRLKEPFNKAFFLILNVAVGGHWPGNPSNETILPQKMHVDYIRAYQKF